MRLIRRARSQTLVPPTGPGVPVQLAEQERPVPFAPHCDQRILHAPGECRHCDAFPDWQELRAKWGIAFTGQLAPSASLSKAPRFAGATEHAYRVMVAVGDVTAELPCPADFNRPPHADNDHRRWGGNVAQP